MMLCIPNPMIISEVQIQDPLPVQYQSFSQIGVSSSSSRRYSNCGLVLPADATAKMRQTLILQRYELLLNYS